MTGSNSIKGYLDACKFDLCAFEGSPNQHDALCDVLSQFNDECVQLFLANSPTAVIFNWRTVANCGNY